MVLCIFILLAEVVIELFAIVFVSTYALFLEVRLKGGGLLRFVTPADVEAGGCRRGMPEPLLKLAQVRAVFVGLRGRCNLGRVR